MTFANIRGADQWAAELKKLIEQARQEADSAKRRKLSERLTDFIVASHPTNEDERAAINELDEMAAVVSERVLIDDAQQRLQAIASRANALAKLQKDLEGATTKNLKAARSIRLENLHAAISLATNVVESLNKVRGDLGEDKDEEKDAKTKIDKVVKAVQDARNLMEGLSLGLG